MEIWSIWGEMRFCACGITLIDLCLIHWPFLTRLSFPSQCPTYLSFSSLYSLRTLEFWVDNLNPDFLYPILSQRADDNGLTGLMEALCGHLHPAPYPYGLLTSRLLGKLGGKNRTFLREPMDIGAGMNYTPRPGASLLQLECQWTQPQSDDGKGDVNQAKNPHIKFSVPMDEAIHSACSTLELFCAHPRLVQSGDQPYRPKESDRVLFYDPNHPLHVKTMCRKKMELIDLQSYSDALTNATVQRQATSAFHIVRAALVSLMGKHRESLQNLSLPIAPVLGSPPSLDSSSRPRASPTPPHPDGTSVPSSRFDFLSSMTSDTLCTIAEGLLWASLCDHVLDYDADNGNISKETQTQMQGDGNADVLVKGLFSHMLLVIATYHNYIEPVDPSGKAINSSTTNPVGVPHNPHVVTNTGIYSYVSVGTRRDAPVGKLNPLSIFGLYRLTGPLNQPETGGGINLFVVNEALVDVICRAPSEDQLKKLLQLIEFLGQASKQVSGATTGRAPRPTTQASDPRYPQGHPHPVPASTAVGDYYFDHLLFVLCDKCTSSPWNIRPAIYECLDQLLKVKGRDWARPHQDHILHTAMYVLKDAPREIPSARQRALLFCVKSFIFLYGVPPSRFFADGVVRFHDSLLVPVDEDGLLVNRRATLSNSEAADSKPPATLSYDSGGPPPLSDAVLHMLLLELSSMETISRFGVRHCLEHFCAVSGCSLSRLLNGEWLSFLKKSLLSRSIRSLPLPEQVAVVESLAFLFDKAPDQFPLGDQEVLSLLSELVKLTATADGAMNPKEDEAFPLVDKNGYVSWKYKKERRGGQNAKHTSSLFLGEAFQLTTIETGGIHVDVPPDLPHGVQLRVAILILFRAVIRRHTHAFLDEPTSISAVRNIRPHVISLLFRSLVSTPPQAVAVAHSALKDVLTLDAPPGDPIQHPHQQRPPKPNRLPKELLQACIKPVLLDLRDYTKLTIPLLRGLARLLSLLATWFNKTLGDKLLEHLSRWQHSEKIANLGVWKKGEEPLIAAAMIGLFELLPQGEQFVDALVKTVIKLETASYRYRLPNQTSSPYRAPLTKYCNRYASVVLEYFLSPARLIDPGMYLNDKSAAYFGRAFVLLTRVAFPDTSYALSLFSCSSLTLSCNSVQRSLSRYLEKR
jgi:hypothetical protein